MYSSHSVLKERALQSLKGKWDNALGIFIVYFIIVYGVMLIPGIGNLLSLFIGGPLTIGICLYGIRVSKNENVETKVLFEGFQNYGTALSAYILVSLYSFLWALLFIVPGIIALISYSQTFYLLAENPSMQANEAINKSKTMMDGHKARYFGLILSFAGWFILCLLSFGIGFLWLAPYANVTFTKFYEELKGDENIDVIIPDIIDSN